MRAAKLKSEAAAIAAADLFDKLQLAPGERVLALHTLIILELLNDSHDYDQYVKNLEQNVALICRAAEVYRPAIERALAARRAAQPT